MLALGIAELQRLMPIEIFRDPKGKVMVLHRARDGKMELIEAP